VNAIVINYPKPDYEPFYKEEEAGDMFYPPITKLFPLSQYKFRDPCKCDKCLIRMACTQICEDKRKYNRWVSYKDRRRRWFAMLDVSIYLWAGTCVGGFIAIILSILAMIYNQQ
jgi:ferredoxin